MILYVGDRVEVHEDSQALLSFSDMTTFHLRPGTMIDITSSSVTETKLQLILGNILVNVKRMIRDASMEISMSQAVAGIRGTVLRLEETGARSSIWVCEGSANFRHRTTGETVALAKGQTASATRQGMTAGRFDPTSTDFCRFFSDLPTEPARVQGFAVQAGRRTLPQGGSVTVPVWLVNTDALANMNVNIYYDPAVVRPARNAARGNIIPQSLFEANVRDRGMVRLGFAQREDIRGTGTLAQIPFEAVGRAGTKSPLRVEVTMASAAGGDLVTPAQLIHGEIVIVGADGRGPGDTTGRGALTAADAMNALKMSVGNLPVDLVADLDGDGRVTSRDATSILQRVVGR